MLDETSYQMALYVYSGSALAIVLCLAIWLLPRIWRLVLQLFTRLKNFLSGRDAPQPDTEPPTPLDPNLLTDRQPGAH